MRIVSISKEIQPMTTPCPTCKRRSSGYLDSNKTLPEMTGKEIREEIPKYEAKLDRIGLYIEDLKKGSVTPQKFPDGKPCPKCGQGWREFQDHKKDLEQLTEEEAEATRRATTRDLDRLKNAVPP
jgi:hypothetical protein